MSGHRVRRPARRRDAAGTLLVPVLIPVLAAALLTGALPRPAGAQDASVPVAGTFSYEQGDLRGVVHAVRRVPGGTAVYYSVGAPAGAAYVQTRAVPLNNLSDRYGIWDAAPLSVVDPAGLRLYQPMTGRDGCLCGDRRQVGATAGRLYVGYVVVPPLPSDVQRVTVVGFGRQVPDVPVEEGALTPAVPGDFVELGTGWPALPDDAAISGVADPRSFVQPLVRHTADVDRRVRTSERPGRVEVELAADVFFAVDEAVLTRDARQTLDDLARSIRERAEGEVVVQGHTDATGSPAHNQDLSLRRAQAVERALRSSLPPGLRISATGRGEREPVADNSTEDGRSSNRRVTVAYSVKGRS